MSDAAARSEMQCQLVLKMAGEINTHLAAGPPTAKSSLRCLGRSVQAVLQHLSATKRQPRLQWLIHMDVVVAAPAAAAEEPCGAQQPP
eukprot:COSAG02_NODE_35782_length_463_cov_1.167582_1_plen_87_part_10